MALLKFIKKSWQLYLDNPILILPFFFYGLFSQSINFYISTSVSSSLFPEGSFTPSVFGVTFHSDVVLSQIAGSIFKYILIIFAFQTLLIILYSFTEAYSIGLSKIVSKSKKYNWKSALRYLDNGIKIIFMRFIIYGLWLIGAIVFIVPLTLISDVGGFLVGNFLLLIYWALLGFFTLFAQQSIVLKNTGPWSSIVDSYKFMLKRFDDMLLFVAYFVGIAFAGIILFVLLMVVSSGFLSNSMLILSRDGFFLIIIFMILIPYFTVIKTIYFDKYMSKKRSITKKFIRTKKH